MIPCLNPVCERERHHDGYCEPTDDGAEPVAQLFTYEQMLEKLDRLEGIVNAAHALCDKPDFRASSGLIKVESLREVLGA